MITQPQEVLTVDRVARITSLVDVTTAKGIEIGGNDQPIALPEPVHIHYVDSSDWHPGTRLAEAVADWAPVDYVIASQVIGPLADPIDWLDQIAEALTDEGYLCLAVFDKRFTADARRPASSTGQFLDANLRGLTQPTTQQIFDDAAFRLRDPDTVALWNGRDPRTFERRGDEPVATAYQLCLEHLEATGNTYQTHANVFTDHSFVDLLTDLAAMGLLEFAVAEFMPTRRFDVEFFVTLQKLPSWLTPEARRLRQEAGFALCRERLARADRVLVGEPDEPPTLPSVPAVAAYLRSEGGRVVRDLAAQTRRAKTRAAAFRDRKS